MDNIKKAKFFFLSHGHPDHIDPESFELFQNKTLIIGDHYGDRIYNDLKQKYNCIKIKSNTWFDISKNIDGFDLNFNAKQAFNKNADQEAKVSLSRKF